MNAIGTGNLCFNTSPHRYLLGPTVEVRLLFGLGIEMDALYRHLHYSSVGTAVDVVINTNTTGDAWEFPVLGGTTRAAPSGLGAESR